MIDTTDDVPVFISTVSLGELAFGVHACADAADRARRAAHLRQLERRPVLDVTRHTAAAANCAAASVALLTKTGPKRVRRNLATTREANARAESMRDERALADRHRDSLARQRICDALDAAPSAIVDRPVALDRELPPRRSGCAAAAKIGFMPTCRLPRWSATRRRGRTAESRAAGL
ncbi:hypothetical protein LGN17_24590 [Burkholderia sp. AU30280]|uniref:hypothetical protein n=1 Tax=Burkholderia sp. AU30280 TaxID=2879628 RepID=UPI001CF1C61C|nr:hypothetical protein [Burkholderia sp. AU30280]MCA8275663.1 hypothetical protein [Burkholderia sp. AU30280]